jgi:hypothetical protein
MTDAAHNQHSETRPLFSATRPAYGCGRRGGQMENDYMNGFM